MAERDRPAPALLTSAGTAMVDAPQRLWVLIDAAGLPGGRADIDDAAFEVVACLFTGDLENELSECAPYLALLGTLDDGARVALERLVNLDCAVLLTSSDPALTFAQAHRHWRKFNVVYGPDGSPLFFRYYDGRVLTSVLQTLDTAQLKAFFGPFSQIFLSAQSGLATRLQLVNERLVSSLLEQPLHMIELPC